MSLATKYRPKTWDDVSEQEVIVKILSGLCSSENLQNRNFLLIGPAGCGKAQPLDSNVLTPDGFIQMKDVKVGTKVFTGKGNIGTVSGVYPQGVRPIYEIELRDYTRIRVSDEHLNVWYRKDNITGEREDFCMTTKDLISVFNDSYRSYGMMVDTPKVDWDKRDLPMDPYLVGALLVCGFMYNDNKIRVKFGNSDSGKSVVSKISDILSKDWKKELRCSNRSSTIVDITYVPNKYTFHYNGKDYYSLLAFSRALYGDGYPLFDHKTILNMFTKEHRSYVLERYPELSEITMTVNDGYRYSSDEDPFYRALKELSMIIGHNFDNTRIPEMYLYSDRSTRISLLQGILDASGIVSNDGWYVFLAPNDGFSEDFAFLVRSLGIKDYNSGNRNHALYTSNEHFIESNSGRRIESIRYVGNRECQCIMVDHEDHTYISDGFIPTHNTTSARLMANVLNDGQGEPIEIDAASHGSIDSIREIVGQAKLYPVGCKYKVFIIDEVHALSNAAWQVMLKTLEEGPARSVFIMCTTDPEKIPATIISRVQTFQLSKISLEGITKRLIHILDSEIAEGQPYTYDVNTVNYIAKMANGGMRDAITLLEKALAFSNDINPSTVEKALGLPKYDDYFDLLQAYAKKDNAAIARIVNSVYNSGINFVKWFEQFHSFVMNVVKYILLKDINLTMIPAQYQDKIAKYGVNHTVICLKLANKLVKLNAELRTTQYLQELALTYLCSIPKKEA